MTDSVTAVEDQSARILSIADMLNTNDIQKSRRVLDKLVFMSTRFAVVKCGGDAGIADLSASPPDIMTKTAFNLLYENNTTSIESKNSSREISVSNLWLKWAERRQYLGGIVFAPGKTVRRDQLNLFTGFAVEPRNGCWERMQGHLRDVVCQRDERHYEWLMSWLADIVQNPGQKLGTAVCLRGKKGSGKSIVFDQFRRLIGHQYSTTISSKRGLTGNFNKHLMTALFAQVEEAVWAGDKDGEGTLKHLITSDRIAIEPKGLDVFEVDNFTRFGFTTNEAWALPASAEERRYFILDVSEERMQDTRYFEALMIEMENAGGLEAWMHALMEWKKPDWVDLRNPPKTAALGEQVLESLPVSDLFFVEAVRKGTYFHDDRKDFVLADTLFADYSEFVKERGARFSVTSQKFGKALVRVWGDERKERRYINGVKATIYHVCKLEDMREEVAANLNIPIDLLQ